MIMGSAKGLLLRPSSRFSELSDVQDLGYPVCVAGCNAAVQIPKSEEK